MAKGISMLSEHQSATSAKNGSLADSWWKKIFARKNGHQAGCDEGRDRRDSFRLELNDLHPLDACLTLNDGEVICTVIEDLSASGFSCVFSEPVEIHGGEPMTVVFVLPMDEPMIIKTEALLINQSVNGTPYSRMVRFRFCQGMTDTNRELIHRYIIKKQFEMIREKQQKF